ncbi:MAG TPA: hypothetical protein VJT33_02910 [bacterium]|nr:hypothetical protein [bacterium]
MLVAGRDATQQVRAFRPRGNALLDVLQAFTRTARKHEDEPRAALDGGVEVGEQYLVRPGLLGLGVALVDEAQARLAIIEPSE